jgi:transcriptional regulator with XRE-family HTH domain
MHRKAVKAVLERLSVVLGAKTSQSLAEQLGVSPQTVSSWKGRESVPYAQCVEVAERYAVSLDWLLTGEGPMRRGEEGQAALSLAESPREQAMLALWRELDEDAQREIQRAAEEKKRLITIEQRLAELEAVVADGKRLA